MGQNLCFYSWWFNISSSLIKHLFDGIVVSLSERFYSFYSEIVVDFQLRNIRGQHPEKMSCVICERDLLIIAERFAHNCSSSETWGSFACFNFGPIELVTELNSTSTDADIVITDNLYFLFTVNVLQIESEIIYLVCNSSMSVCNVIYS